MEWLLRPAPYITLTSGVARAFFNRTVQKRDISLHNNRSLGSLCADCTWSRDDFVASLSITLYIWRRRDHWYLLLYGLKLKSLLFNPHVWSRGMRSNSTGPTWRGEMIQMK